MGAFGQDRTPGQDVRVRRSQDQWQADGTVVEPDGGIDVGDDGALFLLLDESTPSESGLITSATGTKLVTQGVVGLDASGVKVNIGDLLKNDGSDNLVVDEDELYRRHQTWS